MLERSEYCIVNSCCEERCREHCQMQRPGHEGFRRTPHIPDLHNYMMWQFHFYIDYFQTEKSIILPTSSAVCPLTRLFSNHQIYLRTKQVIQTHFTSGFFLVPSIRCHYHYGQVLQQLVKNNLKALQPKLHYIYLGQLSLRG